MHLLATANIVEDKRSTTPATSPRLGLFIQSVLKLSDAGLVRVVGEHKLSELQPVASWDDFLGVWIVIDGSHTFARLATTLRRAQSDYASVAVQPWRIRYPARHKKNDPKKKRKRKRRHPTCLCSPHARAAEPVILHSLAEYVSVAGDVLCAMQQPNAHQQSQSLSPKLHCQKQTGSSKGVFIRTTATFRAFCLCRRSYDVPCVADSP